MRIVLDLQACQATNRERGIGRYAMSLAQGIARRANVNGRDHDLRIVLNNRFPDSVEAIRHAFDGLLPRDRISVFEVPSGVAAMDPGSGWRIRAAERIREHYLAALQPDLVHVASLFEGWVDDAVSSVAQSSAQTGSTAVTLFDLIPLMRQEIYLTNPRMRDWYYRKLQALKSADLLLAISDFTRSEALSALQLPSEQIINISSAIDDMFRPQILDEQTTQSLRQRYGLSRPFLMYTGGIDFRKNIDGLIEAFARLPETSKRKFQLAIICSISDADRLRLQALAKRVGLARDALVLTGYVPDDDLVALYNSATAFVFPSLHEGFGLPALEAMACGTPTIGANASSIPEVIGRADALFDPNDIDAMAAKIAQVLSDDGFRDNLRQSGLAQARQFSWDACAQRALAGFEALHDTRQTQAGSPGIKAGLSVPRGSAINGRPRLAYLSPFPPEKSGIADYSAELITELVRYYDIEVIARSDINDPWILANCTIRSIAWFEEHADEFDRIIYHFGNSEFHEHMFDLLSRFPGIVVLHDFFLSGIINHLEHTNRTPNALVQSLYESHGYAGLIKQQSEGRLESIWAYPCNKKVLDDATGVIVHSQFSKQLAATWYGAGSADDWAVIPLLRAAAVQDRQTARKRLGLTDQDFLTCSFGLLGPTKLNDQMLEAWLNSPLAANPNCQLVFVGENHSGVYGETLRKTIDHNPYASRIKITGFASRALYQDYLAAADSAVQLRSMSRGETSASILDCLAHGVPTIINANGSAGELPDDVLLKMPDEFSETMLCDALSHLHQDHELARNLSARALAYIQSRHHPYRIGQMYREAIEQFALASPAANHRLLVQSLASLEATAAPDSQDLMATARSIALNQSIASSPRQLLVDISELVQRDAKSGIQRVVRNVLNQLLRNPPQGYRVEPVYESDGQYMYARRFACDMLGLTGVVLQDAVIEVRPRDRFLGLDLLPHGISRHKHLFVDLRNHGVEVFFVVYDMLPVLLPSAFVANADAMFSRWLQVVTSVSDGVLCISRAVADELLAWMEATPGARLTPLRVGYFHLGADITGAAVTSPTTEEPAPEVRASQLLAQMKTAPTILMVGTLEPRKAHAQALAAFELLWAQGHPVNLVIVGKNGWMVDALVKRLREHPENAKRLFWLESASDTLLLQLYASSSALLAASEAEGFGLPLIEAAQHGLPVIARDLPVFKEVAGEHAFYFSGASPEALAGGLREWLELHAAGQVPASNGMPWLTWAQSTQHLLQVIEQQDWYRTIA